MKNSGFAALEDVDAKRLLQCVRVLEKLAAGSVANDAVLQRALTTDEFAAYGKMYDLAVTHTEDEWSDARPAALSGYIELLKRADLYNALADRFGKVRVGKRTKRVLSTGPSLRVKAEGYYERAREYLQAITADAADAAEIERWLDRSVSWTAGEEPGIDAASIPRVRGSRSVYAADSARPLWGVKRGKFWRQREAVTLSVLPLIYAEEAFDVQPQAVFTGKLQRILTASKTVEEC